MKKLVCLFVVATFALATSCKEKGQLPAMTFSDTEHDFGDINQGDKVSYDFEFKNTGGSDLLISNAVGSCGCTVPQYPKEAIKPGASGKIMVTFNSTGKHGEQHKSVTLSTNTEKGSEILKITANINAKPLNMQPVATPNQ